MKAIQITIDEKLLAVLDKDEDVRRLGRSAVLRCAAAEYIEKRRRNAISVQYRKAYGPGSDGLGDEFDGWEDQGEWPRE